jgi:hypothetical protein
MERTRGFESMDKRVLVARQARQHGAALRATGDTLPLQALEDIS